MPSLIILSGLVGSGKSTQGSILHDVLRRRGTRVTKTYLKTMNILSHILIVFILKIIGEKSNGMSPWRFLAERRRTLVKKLFNLLVIADCISLSIKFLIRIYIPLLMNNSVIVEEYLSSTIADYISFKSRGLWGSWGGLIISLAQRYHAMVREMSYFIYLYAPQSILRERWRSRGTLFERNGYLEMQQRILRGVIRQLGGACYLEISTAYRPPYSVTKEILGHLKI